MSAVKYMKDPSVKVNKNWGHNRPAVSSKPGEYAYLSPLIREVCVQCKELNEQLIEKLGGKIMSSELNGLTDLNKASPDTLQRVIYDKSVYDTLMKKISLGAADDWKTLIEMDFAQDNTFKDGIWIYNLLPDDNIAVTLDTDAFSRKFGEAADIRLDYEDMPHEILINSEERSI